MWTPHPHRASATRRDSVHEGLLEEVCLQSQGLHCLKTWSKNILWENHFTAKSYLCKQLSLLESTPGPEMENWVTANQSPTCSSTVNNEDQENKRRRNMNPHKRD